MIMLTTILDSANHALKCKSCNQNVYANQAHEFMNQVYHKSCLKCKKCSKPLQTFANEHQSSCAADLVYLDKNRDLICFDDLIRSFKCSICLNGFQLNSNICQITGNYQESSGNISDDNIAHYECMTCMQCNCKICALSEYSYDGKKKILLCKVCQLNRIEVKQSSALKKNSQRLSTRQKELIKAKFLFIDDIDKFMDYKIDIYKYAIELNCSKKTISDYLVNYINRKTRQKLPKNSVSNKKSQIEYTVNMTNNVDMITQLTKLDKTLPPNQSPFEKLKFY